MMRLAQGGLVLVLLLAFSGCATRGPVLAPHVTAEQSPVAELQQTPFFPQKQFQCGPAALATVLSATGIDADPDTLTAQVYIPDRRGSLQPELLAATRRHDRIPYVIAPTVDAVLAEVGTGRPVLVLQNLGISSMPVWHYAVVIGFDAQADTLILRSGTKRRQVMRAERFVASWERAGSWGFVALRPGELPAAMTPERYLQAVSDLEAIGYFSAARAGYVAALQRWPDSATAWLGLGTVHYHLGDRKAAEDSYRRSLVVAPENAVARNNLAQVLLERGCREAALHTIDAALAIPSVSHDLRAAMTETRSDILHKTLASEETECPRGFP